MIKAGSIPEDVAKQLVARQMALHARKVFASPSLRDNAIGKSDSASTSMNSRRHQVHQDGKDRQIPGVARRKAKLLANFTEKEFATWVVNALILTLQQL